MKPLTPPSSSFLAYSLALQVFISFLHHHQFFRLRVCSCFRHSIWDWLWKIWIFFAWSSRFPRHRRSDTTHLDLHRWFENIFSIRLLCFSFASKTQLSRFFLFKHAGTVINTVELLPSVRIPPSFVTSPLVLSYLVSPQSNSGDCPLPLSFLHEVRKLCVGSNECLPSQLFQSELLCDWSLSISCVWHFVNSLFKIYPVNNDNKSTKSSE